METSHFQNWKPIYSNKKQIFEGNYMTLSLNEQNQNVFITI